MTREEFFDQYAIHHGYDDAQEALKVRDKAFVFDSLDGIHVDHLVKLKISTPFGILWGFAEYEVAKEIVEHKDIVSTKFDRV